MKRLFTLLTLTVLLAVLNCYADGFTSSPFPLVESSRDVVIRFDANGGGNDKLLELDADNPLYAHIGVYTTKSPSTWSHVKTSWPSGATDTKANTEANRFAYKGNGIWELSLGDLRSYFDVTDSSEHITAICILARNAAGTQQTSDNFIYLSADEFAIELRHDGPTILTGATDVNISLGSTREAALTLSLDGAVIGQTNGTMLTVSHTFSTEGSYKVLGTAIYDGTTLTREMTVVVAGAPKAVNYPGGTPRMGTVTNSDGSVTFCIAAPGKQTCWLFGSWSNYQADEATVMNYQDWQGNRYFWTTVKGLDKSTYYPYYFQIDKSVKVGDPYAHLVLDPYNDRYIKSSVFPDMPQYPVQLGNVMLGVYRGDLDEYDWQVRDFSTPDHYSLSIYELLLRDFTGTSRVADGTLRAAIERIPYLSALGINAVELLPIMEFNGNNSWGYNTNFYMAPDKAYGTPDDYKEFIDTCHEYGIAVILDIVFNQSDGLHPWYQMYDIKNNPFYNATAPHKWSVLNDWNQGNELVQQQWKDAIRYWLEVYRVDGFRFDLVKGLGLNEHYTSNGGNTDSYIKGRVEMMKRINEYITEVKPDAIHINELLGDAREDNENFANGGQMGWMNANENACQYAMGYNSNSNLNGFMATNWSRTKGAVVSYAESHDEQRMGFKQKQWAPDAVKNDLNVRMKRLGSVAAQMLVAPGPHMMWMFGELGADENTKDATFSNNDTSPKPVYWKSLSDPDRAHLHSNYSALLNLRKNNPRLFSTDAKVSYSGFGNTFNGRAIVVSCDGQEAVLLLNPSLSENVTVSAKPSVLDAATAQLVTASEGYAGVLSSDGGSVSAVIPPHSFALYVSSNVNGIDSVTDNSDEPVVTVVDGSIYVGGDYTTLEVFDVAGRRVADRDLPAGIYIVRVDGSSTRVLVR